MKYDTFTRNTPVTNPLPELSPFLHETTDSRALDTYVPEIATEFLGPYVFHTQTHVRLHPRGSTRDHAGLGGW